MSHDNHTWKLGCNPPQILEHSLAKHRVIDQYLREYVRVLTSHIKQDRFRLTLVDGFAGGGLYNDSNGSLHLGSPLLMLNAIREAEREAFQRRTKKFVLHADYYFVEKDENAFEFLENAVSTAPISQRIHGEREKDSEKINLIKSECKEAIPGIIESIKRKNKSQRVIFLLDQFGYNDAPFDLINLIFRSLKAPEVILTFAVDFLLAYLSPSKSFTTALKNMGSSLSAEELLIHKDKANGKAIIQHLLHRDIFERSGAKFYTPFFLRSKASGRDLWLIHLSGVIKAKDVMLQQHWANNTAFVHYGKPGLNMLGYDPESDQRLTSQLLLRGFEFDQTARQLSVDALMSELPKQLRLKDSVQFNQLFGEITNESPITSEILREVIAKLNADRVITIRDGDGSTLRRSGIQNGNDVIRLSPQKTFVLKYD